MSAHIRDHWLHWDDPEIELVRKRERSSGIIEPTVIVIHYGVTLSQRELVAAQRASGYWAHLSIDGDGPSGKPHEIHQSMPFNERGSHAGRSMYNGRSSVNGFSIGIEIANPGPVFPQPDGTAKDVYGRTYRGVVEPHDPPDGFPRNWKHWAHYTDRELDILVEACRALRAEYPIVDVVGHSEISPGRKFDPGPAFPLDWLRKKVL